MEINERSQINRLLIPKTLKSFNSKKFWGENAEFAAKAAINIICGVLL